jgi:dTDP-4-dehydrorhamnose reductase
MSRLLVTGAAGQLGQDLLRLEPGALGIDLAELDLTDGLAVRAFLAADKPEVVIHGAAYTAVDKAEADEERAYLVNATASAHLAAACAAVGARLVAVSTDYVFAGDATQPYEPTDEPAPRSAYGRTKLAGELAVREILPASSHVVRSAWVWGAGGANIVKTVVRLEATRETVSFVEDQRGSPTWSRDLAAGLLELAGRPDVPAGILHATGGGETTWFGFAGAIFTELGADPGRVLPTTTETLKLPATRPAYSVLSPRAWIEAGLTPLPHWREALHTAFADPEVAAALRPS